MSLGQSNKTPATSKEESTAQPVQTKKTEKAKQEPKKPAGILSGGLKQAKASKWSVAKGPAGLRASAPAQVAAAAALNVS